MFSKVNNPRVWVLGGLLLVLALFAVQQLSASPDLVALQLRIRYWSLWVATHPVLGALSYTALFVLVATFSIPVTPLLSLAGGALFGFAAGLPLVLVSRSAGATLAAALARWLLRSRLRRRYGNAMQRFDAGVQRDGLWYLLSLRLFPAMPFTLVNLLAGLSAMRLWTFCWVSLIGMVPAAALQVLAGAQLARLQSLNEVWRRPLVLLGLAVLALLPLLLRGWMRKVRPDKAP